MPIIRKKQRQMLPARILVFGFASVIAIGTLLLLLPFATRDGQTTSFVEALFTATSATCVTGITLFDTYSHFTMFGHIVIMILLQAGGIGMLTLVTFFNLMIGRKLGLLRARNVVSEHSFDGLSDFRHIFSKVIIYAFIMEGIGVIILLFIFIPIHGGYGVFMSMFTAISAFCHAGFDLFGINNTGGNNYLVYMDKPIFQIVIMVLVILGGFGFVVWHNIMSYRKNKKLSLHTKVVLSATVVLIFFGAAIYFMIVLTSREFDHLSLGDKVLGSFFTSVAARTAGLTGYGIATINDFSELFTMILMFIGGAPGSTAGGIKVTTFVILLSTVICVIKGHEDTVIMGHNVKKEVVYKTITVLCLSLFFVLAAFLIIYLQHDKYNTVDILFEVTSAFTTTGFSNGFSVEANTFSRIILIVTMFIGRIGPVSMMLSLTLGKHTKGTTVLPESTILVG